MRISNCLRKAPVDATSQLFQMSRVASRPIDASVGWEGHPRWSPHLHCVVELALNNPDGYFSDDELLDLDSGRSLALLFRNCDPLERLPSSLFEASEGPISRLDIALFVNAPRARSRAARKYSKRSSGRSSTRPTKVVSPTKVVISWVLTCTRNRVFRSRVTTSFLRVRSSCPWLAWRRLGDACRRFLRSSHGGGSRQRPTNRPVRAITISVSMRRNGGGGKPARYCGYLIGRQRRAPRLSCIDARSASGRTPCSFPVNEASW